MIKWIREYLSGRESYVRLNSTQSRKKGFKHGVPQGGVLSPKLFILFIDDIVKDLGPEVEVSLFADDLAVWVQHEDPKESERLMQLAIGKIEQWAKRWKMELNAAKTEYILFSNWNRESKWEGQLVLNGQQIKRNDPLKFLGVRFGWNMTFTSYVKQVKDKMRQRLRALRAVSHKRWGSRTEDLRTLFIGFVTSVAEYAGAAWMTAASDMTIQQVEVEQNIGARLITGCLASTAIDALLVEADLVPLQLRGRTAAANAREKYRRDNHNPNRKIIESQADTKNQREMKGKSWRAVADKVTKDLETRDTEPEPVIRWSSIAPWANIQGITLQEDISEGALDNDSNQDEGADYQVYIDGSIQEGEINGGAGYTIHNKDGTIIEDRKAAGALCSAFKAEAFALYSALA